MLLSDLFRETSSALLVNKARSGLTILGIIIGIGSVITMIALGQGTSVSIESSIESLGSNLLLITPGATKNFGFGASGGRGTSQTLTFEDADAIKNLLSNHHRYTKSMIAKEVLDDFKSRSKKFVKVMPLEYKRVLGQKELEEKLELTEVSDG